MREREGLRTTFPVYYPVGSRPPTISIHEKREVSVMEKKLAIEPLDRDWNDVFASDKIERGIGVIEKRLGLESLETHYFETSRTSNTQLGS